jgi:hypothetical protein
VSAVITGKVSGSAGPSNTLIRVMGAGVSGLGLVAEDGSYRIQLQGTLPAVVDLLAEQGGFDSPTIGLRRNIAVSEGQEVSGQDISLDHPFNQQLRLNPGRWYRLKTMMLKLARISRQKGVLSARVPVVR